VGKGNAPSGVRRKLNARAMQQALKDSRDHLIAIKERWRQDTAMAAFLAQIEAAAQSLAARRREQILDRLNAARPLLGDTDASRSFSGVADAARAPCHRDGRASLIGLLIIRDSSPGHPPLIPGRRHAASLEALDSLRELVSSRRPEPSRLERLPV
jgi:hypothetical protein